MRLPQTLLLLAVTGMLFVANRAPAANDNGPVQHKPTLKDVIQQTKQTLRAVQAYTFQQKDEYEKRLRHSLHDIDQQIDVLKERTEQATGRAQKRFQKQLTKLRKLRTQADEQLQKVREATPGTWNQLKQDMGSVIDKIGRGLEQLGHQIQR